MGPKSGLIEDVDFPLLRVSANGSVWAITRTLLERIGLPAEEVLRSSVVKFLPIEFLQDLILKKNLGTGPFSGYRAELRRADGTRVPIEITGYPEGAGPRRVYTLLVMESGREAGLVVDLGRFEENVRAQQLLKRYISKQLVARVESAVSKGLADIPNQERHLTFLFADLVAYTEISENTDTEEVVDMLNVFIGAISSIVLHNGGFVDKIMGDSVFAVFESPLFAVLSAVEVQKQFNMLNFFRVREGQPEVLLRVGIHAGACVLASIGSSDFMELTFIGDSVNTASRLEKACTPGAILASQAALASIRDRVGTSRSLELQVKGKRAPLHAEYVHSITVNKGGRDILIDMDESVF